MATFSFSYFMKNFVENHKRFIPTVGVSIFMIYCYWSHWEKILSSYKNKSGLMAKKNIPNGVDPWKW
ncbi:Peptide transporter imqJ [Trichinella pseudospiralis]